MAGRMGAGILVTCCLLLPSALSAQEAPPVFDAPSPAGDAASRQPGVLIREIEQLKQRVQELETTQTAHEDATRGDGPDSSYNKKLRRSAVTSPRLAQSFRWIVQCTGFPNKR